MSMRIEGNPELFRSWDEEKGKEMQKKPKTEPEEKKNAFAPEDAYVSSEKSGRATGLYQIGKDEEGNRTVFFDDPKKPKAEGEEKCITNTDKVDREIRKLKEEAKRLKQQIHNGDEEEKKRLGQRLAQVEMELIQKDNDGYRKANAIVSNKE